MTALGLDAATTTGWGVVELVRGQPVARAWGKVRARQPDICGLVAGALAGFKLDVALIEFPYLDKNVTTVITLARVVGRWEQELDRLGVRSELVRGAQWQVGLLDRLITRTSPRAQRKAAAKRWVELVLKLRPGEAGEDESDALCLAAWGAKRAAFAARGVG